MPPAGLRLGWVTAHPQLVDKLTCLIQAHTVGPCSLSQVVLASTLSAWGPGGLHAHLQRVQSEYAHRAQCMLAAAQEVRGGVCGGLGGAAGQPSPV